MTATQPPTAQLKPCPWCNSSRNHIEREETSWTGEKVVGVDENNGPIYYVECDECMARGPIASWAIDARQKWNATPPAVPAEEREKIMDCLADLRAQARDLIADLRAQIARLEGELAKAKTGDFWQGFEEGKREQQEMRELAETYRNKAEQERDRPAAELAAMTKERDKYRWRESQALECVADYLDALDNDTEPASTSAMRLLFEPRELSGRDTAQAELAAMKGGAVTVSDEMVRVAQEAAGFCISDAEMRAALQAVAGMRGGG
jgi:hypothetical protein